MMRRVQVFGAREMSMKLRRIQNQLPDMMENALLTGTMALETQWKLNIQQYPLIRTGTYLRSVHREVMPRNGSIVSVMVGTNLTDPPYPDFLEFGTRRMSAKPTARPALDATEGTVRRDTEAAFRMMLDRAVN
jgi:HK97 gp10 family phage protein